MNTTVVGLVTPHILKIVDIATQAQAGSNVDWHLRDAVAKTIDELGHLYNARDLLSAYVHGLINAANDAGRGRRTYANALEQAAAEATRLLGNL